MLRRTLPAALLALALIPSAAHAAKASEWQYDVTVKAQMTEEWSYASKGEIGTPWDPCTVTEEGKGTASISLSSRRPKRVLVMRGSGGRLPNLNVGTGEGVELRGPAKREGTDVELHTGSAKCQNANPRRDAPTSGCGVKTIDLDWNLAFRDRSKVYPSVIVDEGRESCPSGPDATIEWQNDESPSLMDVTAAASPSKFYGTKQFTIRGAKTFTGTGDDNARHVVTWQWETTFRLVKRKRG
ncbi:MAG TPA: hypothetical protein VN238_09490 [Solirubrobacteraceae bacterium]|nr:hypothetical protein [Solirubrobacteraceae bacterium]